MVSIGGPKGKLGAMARLSLPIGRSPDPRK
jgi:hypothetical protein